MNEIDILKNNLSALTNLQEDIKTVESNYNNMIIMYYYLEEITKLKPFNNYYLEKINSNNYSKLSEYIPGIFFKLNDISKEYLTQVLSIGNLIIIVNDYPYLVMLAEPPKRVPSKSELDPTNLFESKDGLIENVYDNLALIKKRIKSENLIVRKYIIGANTKTTIFLLYMNDFKDKLYVKEIIKTLDNNLNKELVNINDLNNLFSNNSLLPLTFNTGSPDYISSSLLEGRAAIIMDNSPLSLILPSTLSLFTSIKNEISSPKYYTLINRVFNVLFLLLSLFLIPSFIALTNFNPSFFSTLFMANFQLNERGTTFPLFLESILILIMFEFYRHTTSRSPTNYVQNIVIIFGGLFIGQNAINSGLVGSGILLITSISYIASFGLTSNPTLITTFNIFRIYNIILSYLMGLIGVSIGIITTFLYISIQKSINVPFLSPFIPFNKESVKDYFFPKRGDKL